MGLFDFVKDAGQTLFGKDEPEPDHTVTRTPDKAHADKAKAGSLYRLVTAMNFDVEDFAVRFIDGEAKLTGQASSQEIREKIVVLVGNVQGVARVDDDMTVATPAPEAKLHTVERGDTLSKIAKAYYGDAMKYPVIFEANKPMLDNPDKIYPGQVLRIPPIEG